MKKTFKGLFVLATMGASVAQAGTIADLIARHEAKKAAVAASAAAPASSEVAVPGQAAQATQAAAVISYAQRTHAAAQSVVSHKLSNGEKCAELVHEGKLPTATMAQYKCILLGPVAALATAQHAAGAVATK